MGIRFSTTNLVVTWPATATGYTLMSGTNLASSSGWGNVTNTPATVNGFYTVTNPIVGQQKFYYLSQ